MANPPPDGSPGKCIQCGKLTVEGVWTKHRIWTSKCYACQRDRWHGSVRQARGHTELYDRENRVPDWNHELLQMNDDGDIEYSYELP